MAIVETFFRNSNFVVLLLLILLLLLLLLLVLLLRLHHLCPTSMSTSALPTLRQSLRNPTKSIQNLSETQQNHGESIRYIS